MSKTRITISARKRPKKAAKPAAPKPGDKKPSGGASLPGDRYNAASCRVTVADISTLYLSGNGTWTEPAHPDDRTFGRAVIGTSQRLRSGLLTTGQADTWGADQPDPMTSDSILDANHALLYFLSSIDEGG